MHYRIRSRKVYCGEWYPTKMEPIEAFERQCERKGPAPPLRYVRIADSCTIRLTYCELIPTVCAGTPRS